MPYRPIRLLKLVLIILILTIIFEEVFRLFSVKSDFSSSSLLKTKNLFVSSNRSLRKDGDFFEETVERLQPFYIPFPRYFDDEARTWFENSTYYRIHSSRQCSAKSEGCDPRGFLFNDDKDHLLVRVAKVKNGLSINDDCGYNFGEEQVRRTFSSSSEANYDEAILYPVPDGWSFQHFLDGIGPKLSHSRFYLDEYPKAKVIIQRGARFDRSVKEIWQMLGVEESSRLVPIGGHERVAARLLINPCRTPGIHPVLWQNARLMYWSISDLLSKPPSKESRKNFIYIQRTSSNAMNGARLILNEEEMIVLLRDYCQRHSLNYVQYDHSKDSEHIRHRMKLFYNSRYILGVHSGALSNMNFAQSGTTVIEVMPFRVETSSLPMTCSMYSPVDLKACAGYILYTQSQLLNQTYWIFPNLVNQQGNLRLDLQRLKILLQKI